MAKYQPTKWDWVSLEADFLAADEMSVAAFFRGRGVPERTYRKAALGWGEKKLKIRQRGLEILKNRVAKQVADMQETHLTLGKGVVKIGLEALLPGKEGQKGLTPKTAAEAAKMIQLGALIQQKALGNVDALKLAALTSTETPEGLPGQTTVPTERVVEIVRVRLPDNGKEKRG